MFVELRERILGEMIFIGEIKGFYMPLTVHFQVKILHPFVKSEEKTNHKALSVFFSFYQL